MADIDDVLLAIGRDLVAPVLYPNGTAQPSAAGVPVRVMQAWPQGDAIDLDLQGKKLANGVPVPNGVGPVTSVAIIAQPSIERVTSRYPRAWKPLPSAPATISATVAGASVTIGGTVTAGNAIAVLVAGRPYGHAIAAGDTTSSIAAAICNSIRSDIPAASVAGQVITLPDAYGGRIAVNVGAPVTMVREIRRQMHGVQISIFAPTPEARVAVAKVIDLALAGVDFIDLPDGTQAWLSYRAQSESDGRQTASEFRRDLFWWVEYPTVEIKTFMSVTAFVPVLDVTTSPAP